jgi:two-component system LytT family response regulator
MRVVIVDDQKKVCATIKSLIKIHYPAAQVIAEAYNAEEAIKVITQEKPDVVLLDIKMPKESGFDLLKKLKPVDFKLIFITAYEEYAVRAFKFAALDYLMKPIDPSELIDALHKAKQQIQLEDLNAKVEHFISNMGDLDREPKKIVIRSKESLQILNVGDIVRCESDDRYTTFFLSNRKSVMASETLKTYDEMLRYSGFFRAHNSHLVNLSHVRSYEKRNGGSLIMSDESVVPVSVRKKDALLKMLEKV